MVSTYRCACRGGNLPPATLRIQPVRLNGTTYRHAIPRERKRVEESSRVACFILCWFFVKRGGFLHSAFATVGMTMLVRFYGFAHCFHNVSRCTAFPSSVSPSGEPASPKGSSCTVLLGVWFTGTAQRAATRPSPSGKGDRHRRWMRRGTAFRIVGTMGAEVEPPSETVGNGLCAVPLRSNYNLCKQTGTTPGMSFRGS